MAQCGTTSVKFLLRKDTYDTWFSSTVILALGEPSVVTDTGQMKIGDGVHLWRDLPYVGPSASIIFDFASCILLVLF